MSFPVFRRPFWVLTFVLLLVFPFWQVFGLKKYRISFKTPDKVELRALYFRAKKKKSNINPASWVVFK